MWIIIINISICYFPSEVLNASYNDYLTLGAFGYLRETWEGKEVQHTSTCSLRIGD